MTNSSTPLSSKESKLIDYFKQCLRQNQRKRLPNSFYCNYTTAKEAGPDNTARIFLDAGVLAWYAFLVYALRTGAESTLDDLKSLPTASQKRVAMEVEQTSVQPDVHQRATAATDSATLHRRQQQQTSRKRLCE